MIPDVFGQLMDAVSPYVLAADNALFDLLRANGLGWVLTVASPDGTSANPCFDGTYLTCIAP
jgi:hypothetical protein